MQLHFVVWTKKPLQKYGCNFTLTSKKPSKDLVDHCGLFAELVKPGQKRQLSINQNSVFKPSPLNTFCLENTTTITVYLADKKSILSEEMLDKAQDFVTKYKQNFKNLETFLLVFTQFVLH